MDDIIHYIDDNLRLGAVPFRNPNPFFHGFSTIRFKCVYPKPWHGLTGVVLLWQLTITRTISDSDFTRDLPFSCLTPSGFCWCPLPCYC